MNLSWQQSFRALFSGVVLADRWAQLASPSNTAATPALHSWRAVFIRSAMAMGQGTPLDAAIWAALVSAVAAEGSATPQGQSLTMALGLGLLPRLLHWSDDPARGEAALADWLQQHGLSAQARTDLQQLLQLLRRGLSLGPSVPDPFLPAAPSSRAAQRLDWLVLESEGNPILAAAARLVFEAQGQYGLALRRAVELGADPTMPPLVGLLAALAGGLTGLPLGWRLQILNGASGQLELRRQWDVDDEARLWDLADGLFYTWIGVYPISRIQGRSIYPVSQLFRPGL